jgi:hypothetical protein
VPSGYATGTTSKKKADTSTQLAEQNTGSRDLPDGTLNDVIAGRVTAPQGRPRRRQIR